MPGKIRQPHQYEYSTVIGFIHKDFRTNYELNLNFLTLLFIKHCCQKVNLCLELMWRNDLPLTLGVECSGPIFLD